MTFMFPTIFLNSPAISFAVVNILRIWEDFKCLCLSGLFLQKQMRTVFWQQEAYKNLEKKIKIKKLKRFKANSYEKNAPLLPYLKPAKQSGITSRKDHLCTENHTSVCTEGMLPWPPVWVPRRNPWEHFHWWWLSCHLWSLLWEVGETGLSVVSFLLHFSVG